MKNKLKIKYVFMMAMILSALATFFSSCTKNDKNLEYENAISNDLESNENKETNGKIEHQNSNHTLFYIEDGKYIINDNGKIYKICPCVDESSDFYTAKNYYTENNIYIKSKDIYFTVFFDTDTEKSFLYRIYRENGELKFDKIDEIGERHPIEFLYVLDDKLYYKKGGNFGSWSAADTYDMMCVDFDGNLSICDKEVRGMYAYYAAKIDTSFVRSGENLYAFKNGEGKLIDNYVWFENIEPTPYGIYYESVSDKGIHFYDTEDHKIIDGLTASWILPSPDFKKAYIIANETKTIQNLYEAEGAVCKLIKKDFKCRLAVTFERGPNIKFLAHDAFFNGREIKEKIYNKYRDLYTYDSKSEEYGEEILEEIPYGSEFFNDIYGTLYHFEHTNLYKVIAENKEELITDKCDAFYNAIIYDEDVLNIDGLSPEEVMNKMGFKFIGEKNEVKNSTATNGIGGNGQSAEYFKIHEVNYDKDKMKYAKGYEDYIVEYEPDTYKFYAKWAEEDGKKRTERDNRYVVDIDKKLVETDLNCTRMNNTMHFDPKTKNYYIDTTEWFATDDFLSKAYEVKIDSGKVKSNKIAEIHHEVGQNENSYLGFIGNLGNYKIYVTNNGKILAGKGEKDIKEIGKHTNTGDYGSYNDEIPEEKYVINTYEEVFYYISRNYLGEGGTLYKVDDKLNKTEIAKDVICFRALQNEVLYYSNHKEDAIYRYADGKSEILIEGKGKFYGPHNDTKCMIEMEKFTRNRDVFTCNESELSMEELNIWNEFKNNYMEGISAYKNILYVYSEGKVEKVLDDYFTPYKLGVKDVVKENGREDYYIAYKKDYSFVPRDFKKLYETINGGKAETAKEFLDLLLYNYMKDNYKNMIVYIVRGYKVFIINLKDYMYNDNSVRWTIRDGKLKITGKAGQYDLIFDKEENDKSHTKHTYLSKKELKKEGIDSDYDEIKIYKNYNYLSDIYDLNELKVEYIELELTKKQEEEQQKE